MVTVDCVIIDGTSMLDLWLFHSLPAHLPPKAHLVLVGDADQLPSVGAGYVLGDLIASGRVPMTRLDHIFRQGQASQIVTNAHLINTG
jgi:exodeoxyribonuclease V alpha subunit